MNELRPNAERANVAMVLIYVVLFLEMVMFISDYMQYDLLLRIKNHSNFSTDEANFNDLRQKLLAVAFIIVYIVSAVTFIRWFRRAYFNLHLKAKLLQYAEGEAASGWFIPFVCLVKPYRIMTNLFEETGTLISKKARENQPRLKFSIVGIWWTLWIMTNLFGQFSFRYSMNAESIDQLINSTVISMLGMILSAPLAIITLLLIRNYSAVEPLMHDLEEDVMESDIDIFVVGSVEPNPIID